MKKEATHRSGHSKGEERFACIAKLSFALVKERCLICGVWGRLNKQCTSQFIEHKANSIILQKSVWGGRESSTYICFALPNMYTGSVTENHLSWNHTHCYCVCYHSHCQIIVSDLQFRQTGIYIIVFCGEDHIPSAEWLVAIGGRKYTSCDDLERERVGCRWSEDYCFYSTGYPLSQHLHLLHCQWHKRYRGLYNWNTCLFYHTRAHQCCPQAVQ